MANESGIPPHISDFDLTQFADGEMPVAGVTATETHLRTCTKCRARLNQLNSGAAAYDRYHADVLKPSLALPPEWPSLRTKLDSLEKPFNWFRFPAIMWWAAAACCVLAAGWFLYRETPSRRMQQVLAQAVVARTPPHRRLHVTANGHNWYRAASLQSETAHPSVADQRSLEDTRTLFVKANYNWDEPLSARSFAAWRKQLPDKRDQVLSIQDSRGKRRFYRLQTETAAGVLRAAALTVRADTLDPVKGAFQFEHQNNVSIEDAGEMPPLPREPAARSNLVVERPMVVKEVSPEEELHVFAALNAIGADVGEPVTVNIESSKQQVLVLGVGVSANRERQIRKALSPIPNTVMRFTSGQPVHDERRSPNTGGVPSEDGAPLRRMLETKAGGAQQFQSITDKALDASSVILSQANALYVLAQKFPPPVAAAFAQPDRETLLSLRRSHAIAIEKAAAELNDALQPLFSSTNGGGEETQSLPATSWELGAAQLFEQAKLLDGSLGRILAGSYLRETGQGILSKLPNEIQTLEALARSQENIR